MDDNISTGPYHVRYRLFFAREPKVLVVTVSPWLTHCIFQAIAAFEKQHGPKPMLTIAGVVEMLIVDAIDGVLHYPRSEQNHITNNLIQNGRSYKNDTAEPRRKHIRENKDGGDFFKIVRINDFDVYEDFLRISNRLRIGGNLDKVASDILEGMMAGCYKTGEGEEFIAKTVDGLNKLIQDILNGDPPIT